MSSFDPTTKTEMAANSATSMVNEITGRLDWFVRVVADESSRHQEAAACGAKLASTVYEFLQDPAAIGTDALQDAYNEFMGRHAGDFHPIETYSIPG